MQIKTWECLWLFIIPKWPHLTLSVMITWNLLHARISCIHARIALLFLHFLLLLLVKEVAPENPEYSTCDMGYLNSVLSSSSQVHAAEDSPVSGGGLRFVLYPSFFRSRIGWMCWRIGVCFFNGYNYCCWLMVYWYSYEVVLCWMILLVFFFFFIVKC